MCPFSDRICQEVKKFLIPHIPVAKYGGDMFASLQCVESSY